MFQFKSLSILFKEEKLFESVITMVHSNAIIKESQDRSDCEWSRYLWEQGERGP